MVYSYKWSTDDDDDNPPKRCDPSAKNNNLYVTTPWFIYGRASVVKDEICLQYGCKQAWIYETRKRHEKTLHKKYLERSDMLLATSGGGEGGRAPLPF